MLLVGNIRQLIDCGGGFSFPSSHATNHFAVGVYLINIFIKKFRWYMPFFILWAGIISYSQIYVGVHFPIDVIAGGLLGSAIGWTMATIMKKIIKPKLIVQYKVEEEVADL